MGILVIALSINPRPLSALELTLSGLIMGSRVDTAGDNQNPHVIISNYRHDRRADKNSYRHDHRADKNPYPHDRRADSQCHLL